jgi:hypothetical protein
VIPIPLPIIAALAAAAIGAASGWTLRGWRAGAQIEALRADLATAKADHASAVSRAASAALAQSEAHRQTEAAWTRRMQEATDVLTRDRAALAARAAAAAGDAGRLRDQLNTYTCTASSAGPGDTGAASGAGTAQLGDVVDPLLRNFRTVVEAAESCSADVRALLKAWPASGGVKP